VYSLTYKLAYTLRLTLRLTLAYTLVCLSVPWHLATSITANQQSLEGYILASWTPAREVPILNIQSSWQVAQITTQGNAWRLIRPREGV
jgi:hypothetical protein